MVSKRWILIVIVIMILLLDESWFQAVKRNENRQALIMIGLVEKAPDDNEYAAISN
jgi:hypothetical protein